jgi:hypothetical protein
MRGDEGMKFIELQHREDFEGLEKGDLVLVEWGEGSREFDKGNEITCNKIWGIHQENELILDKKTNSYFNIDMFLFGKSFALEAYVIRGG